MYSKFENLNDDKKLRILNAAMKEFSEKGFDKASTNEIVKQADIAKGLLFHYFKNKKQLFLYLYDYCVSLLMQDFFTMYSLQDRDFFIRLRHAQMVKLELLKKYPNIINFVQVAYIEESIIIKAELMQRNDELKGSAASKLFDNIDTELFKDGIELQKVFNIVLWTFEGLANSLLTNAKKSGEDVDYTKAFADVDEYIGIFKHIFYK